MKTLYTSQSQLRGCLGMKHILLNKKTENAKIEHSSPESRKRTIRRQKKGIDRAKSENKNQGEKKTIGK